MSKYKLATLAVFILIIPQITFASWWNPFSWGIFSMFQKVPPQEQIIPPSSSAMNVTVSPPTIASSSSRKMPATATLDELIVDNRR